MSSESRRLFAIEEGYVTIFPEYSPFYCFPVLPSSRTLGSNGWQLVYDLSSNLNLSVNGFTDPLNANASVPFYAKWQDIYMTDLRWNKDPAKVNWNPSGLPYQFTETVGYDCKLTFNAAHFSDALWRLAGFRKSYRVFVDVKSSSIAQVERSWEFRGCTVDTTSYGGSPISIARGFNVKEIPEQDAISTLNVAWRAHNVFQRPDIPLRNTAIEVLDISSGPSTDIVSGAYNLVMTVTGANYVFSYNGIATSSFGWSPNKIITIDGGQAGIITFILVASLAPTASFTESISVNR